MWVGCLEIGPVSGILENSRYGALEFWWEGGRGTFGGISFPRVYNLRMEYLWKCMKWVMNNRGKNVQTRPRIGMCMESVRDGADMFFPNDLTDNLDRAHGFFLCPCVALVQRWHQPGALKPWVILRVWPWWAQPWHA